MGDSLFLVSTTLEKVFSSTKAIPLSAEEIEPAAQ